MLGSPHIQENNNKLCINVNNLKLIAVPFTNIIMDTMVAHNTYSFQQVQSDPAGTRGPKKSSICHGIGSGNGNDIYTKTLPQQHLSG